MKQKKNGFLQLYHTARTERVQQVEQTEQEIRLIVFYESFYDCRHVETYLATVGYVAQM